jgi:AbrB family looped-hinge helix DNA binding protein
MPEVLHTRMSKEGRVLIPAELRHALGLQAEEPLQVYVVDGELRIVSRRQGIRRAQAIAAKASVPGVSVVDEFLADKRADMRADEGQA